MRGDMGLYSSDEAVIQVGFKISSNSTGSQSWHPAKATKKNRKKIVFRLTFPLQQRTIVSFYRNNVSNLLPFITFQYINVHFFPSVWCQAAQTSPPIRAEKVQRVSFMGNTDKGEKKWKREDTRVETGRLWQKKKRTGCVNPKWPLYSHLNCELS